MGTKRISHFDDMTDKIAEKFQMFLIEDGLFHSTENDTSSVYGNINVYKKVYKDKSGKTLSFYIVHWSTYVHQLKYILNSIDDIRNCGSIIPEEFKSKLLNNSLTDVLASISGLTTNDGNVSPMGKIWEALEIQARLSDEKNWFFISGSLGSNVWFETLRNNHTADSKLLSNLNTWFMLSNQLPLIQLKNESAYGAESNNYYSRIFKPDSLTIPKVNIIAFSDPNDLLNFKIGQPQKLNSFGYFNIINCQVNYSDFLFVKNKYLKAFAKSYDKIETKINNKLKKNESINTQINFAYKLGSADNIEKIFDKYFIDKEPRFFFPEGNKNSYLFYNYEDAHFGMATNPRVIEVITGKQ